MDTTLVKETFVNGVTINLAYLDSWRGLFLDHIQDAIDDGETNLQHQLCQELREMMTHPGMLRGHESYINETYSFACWMVRRASARK